MITCPFCRAETPDDSRFCDQCGKELHFCPECRKPKRGTRCPVCGEALVSAEEFFPGPATPSPSQAAEALRLEGDGRNLEIREGVFGRTAGIYPEFSSERYISGTHGRFSRENGGWTVTDLGSTNGTFLNGKRLTANVPAPLKKGDRLRIATSDFKIK